ncbi:SMP-30/gluconolactonase/LRE family protein [Roseitranquillus sediminis]|uniref:SMP-30/gluconolactonase/LRE family protein n=1 Tax=Roseitranquillus sediminis TaxID=2809051 RepID=UPI001D0CB678|nr:SMP-30/gluconolactonase/LRE family protein [Roseitranquillus sediminis]MBM9593650.1 SMP-30/gluconolactonase/LRE family protein [Roseitranquillus sediminis]
MSRVWDATACTLGEGPLWHPLRGQLFWFDVEGECLLTRDGDRTRQWSFGEPVSAAGWIDETTLVVASASRLLRFDVESGAREDICALEADDPATRSNDGRADPWGGFWIGTMGRRQEPRTGSVWRYYNGEMRRLWGGITINNATCFSPDGRWAYFADTPTGIVRRVALKSDDGWPTAEPEDWLDLRTQNLKPDGAVTDAHGNFWSAQFGAGRVACYAPDGRFLRAVRFDAPNTTCPAFGGPDLDTLFCTTGRAGLSEDDLVAAPDSGRTFAADGVARGRPEPKVIL